MIEAKLIEQCLGVYVKYDTRIGRQLADYSDIRSELANLVEMSAYYTRKHQEFLDKYKGADPNRQIDLDDMYPVTGIGTYIVIAYCRCFDNARNHEGKSSRRSIKLQREILKNADPSVLAIHDNIIFARNTMVAHAGMSEIEQHEMRIGIDPEGYTIIKAADDNRRALSMPFVETEQMDQLLPVLLKEVDVKIEVLMEKARVELLALSERAQFIEKLRTRQPVTDSDLN